MVPMGITPLADGRLSAAAAQRNTAPLVAALAPWMAPGACVLELASGTGEHAVAFAQAFQATCPGLHWQPSEPASERRRSIWAWTQALGLQAQIAPPLDLDATQPGWPAPPPQAGAGWHGVLAVNLLHVMPAEGLPDLLRHARAALAPGAWLAVYGPFRCGDEWFSDGNRAFHAQLQAQDPRLGLRDWTALHTLAQAAGFASLQVQRLPANNHLLVWR